MINATLRVRFGRWALLPCFLLAASSLVAQVRTLGFQEMVDAAGMIFVGRVTDVRGGVDSHGDIVTYTTFQVEQPVHGVRDATVTVKQLGGQANGLTTRLSHMRYFERGERVLVMFYPVSDLGFTSPIGLNQGVWSVAQNGTVTIDPGMMGGMKQLARQKGVSIGTSRVMPRSTVINLINRVRKGGSAR